MLFKAVAKRYGDSVEFFVDGVDDVKDALASAKKEAARIFDFSGIGDEPAVKVSPMKEKE